MCAKINTPTDGNRLSHTHTQTNYFFFFYNARAPTTPVPGLTWFPWRGPLLPAAAQAHFAEEPVQAPAAQRACLFAGARAARGGGPAIAAGLARLPFLPDERARDSRGHVSLARG